MRLDSDMVKPVIQEKSPYKITIGEQVCIKCSAMSLTHVKLVWFGPTGAALESVKKFNLQMKRLININEVHRQEELPSKNQAIKEDPGMWIQTRIYLY